MVVMEKAMDTIVKRRGAELHIKEEYWKERACVQACRLRVLCRHVASSNTKARKPPKDEGEEEEEAARAEDDETHPGESEHDEAVGHDTGDVGGTHKATAETVNANDPSGYFVGWDIELRCCWLEVESWAIFGWRDGQRSEQGLCTSARQSIRSLQAGGRDGEGDPGPDLGRFGPLVGCAEGCAEEQEHRVGRGADFIRTASDFGMAHRSAAVVVHLRTSPAPKSVRSPSGVFRRSRNAWT